MRASENKGRRGVKNRVLRFIWFLLRNTKSQFGHIKNASKVHFRGHK